MTCTLYSTSAAVVLIMFKGRTLMTVLSPWTECIYRYRLKISPLAGMNFAKRHNSNLFGVWSRSLQVCLVSMCALLCV